MENKKRILLVGSANMDLSMNVLRCPAPGETLIDDGGVAFGAAGQYVQVQLGCHGRRSRMSSLSAGMAEL